MFIYFIYLDFFLLVVIAICTHAFVEFFFFLFFFIQDPSGKNISNLKQHHAN